MGTQQNRQSQESDSQVRRGDNFLDSDLSRSRSGSLSFEQDLSPAKQGENEAADPGEEQRPASNTGLTFFEREKTSNPTAMSEETAGLRRPLLFFVEVPLMPVTCASSLLLVDPEGGLPPVTSSPPVSLAGPKRGRFLPF